MNIAVCGKEKNDVQQIIEIMDDYAKAVSIDVRLSGYYEDEDLLNSMEQEMDVVCLEIGEDIEKRISLAMLINKMYPECQVVYYSNDLHYATEVYSTVHTYFVLKDEMKKRIGEIFYRIQEEQHAKRQRIQFSVIGGSKLILSPKDIIYFERSKRITRIVSVHGIYEIRDKLSDILNHVSTRDFFRCHNSYMISIAAIREITRTHFVMINGDSVIISRSYKKQADKMFWE